MSLQLRIKKIEQQTAPMKAEQERLRENAELRTEILTHLKDHIERILSLSRYVHGEAFDEEEARKDIVELHLLYHTQATKRYGVDENKHYIATDEQLSELNREQAMRINRQIYSHYETIEQFDKTQEQWKQAGADLDAGVASAESEAAEYLRQLFKRYPRKQNTERFYHIWD